MLDQLPMIAIGALLALGFAVGYLACLLATKSDLAARATEIAGLKAELAEAAQRRVELLTENTTFARRCNELRNELAPLKAAEERRVAQRKGALKAANEANEARKAAALAGAKPKPAKNGRAAAH